MKKLTTQILFVLSLTVYVGCGGGPASSDAGTDSHAGHSEDEHAHEGEDEGHGHEGGHHGEMPATFDEAFESLSEMKDSICKAFADGTPQDAHGALHNVGNLLNALPDLVAAKGDVAPEQMSKVEAAVEQLFDGFGALDGTLHGGAEVKIDDLDKKLTDALNEIKDAVK